MRQVPLQDASDQLWGFPSSEKLVAEDLCCGVRCEILELDIDFVNVGGRVVVQDQ